MSIMGAQAVQVTNLGNVRNTDMAKDVSKADLTSVLGYNNLSPANLLSCLRFYGLPTEGDPVSKVETLLEFCAPRV